MDFSEAVGRDLLSDYKVIVLAVDEKYVSRAFQSQLADSDGLKLDDVVRITGCWNGLSKRFVSAVGGSPAEEDATPMRRAVAFCNSIKASKRVKETFSSIIEQYRRLHSADEGWLSCEVDHVDGEMNAIVRNKALDWLRGDTAEQGNICRILTNARCLSEGVDVPALDAVMFLSPRNSQIDVVQSVGRVMRKSPGKRFGYVILPIGIPADVEPEEALQDNEKYKVVWQVLQALRAHDNRFNALINKIELNEQRPDQIQVVGISGDASGEDGTGDVSTPKIQQLDFNFPHLEEWKNAIFARIVLKCGDRRYWESWAKDVADIAERHVTRINALLEKPKPRHRAAFDEFLGGLRQNLN
ncbi:MAG: helicase-related protein, partial [Actinomycetota bacterium]